MNHIFRFLKQRLTDHRLVLFYAIVMILFGALLIALSLLTGERWTTHFAEISLRFVDHVGVALISIGTIGILLETRDWSNYFQKKIAKTIVQKDYLSTLESNELRTLQGNVLKAIYVLDDVNHEDTLLEYCQQKIHGYIADPYREDVLGFFNIAYTQDMQQYVIEETISYTCRAINKCIQNEVRWTMEAGEILDLSEFEIILKFPQQEFDKPEFRKRHSCLKDLREPELRISLENEDGDVVNDTKEANNSSDAKAPEANDLNELGHFWQTFWQWCVDHRGLISEKPLKLDAYTQGKGYSLGLEPFKDIDKVRVKVRVKYVAPLDRSPTWSMAYPSKKITGIIVYPPDTDFYFDSFGIKRGQVQTEKQLRYFWLRYESWMLPQSGFAFHLTRRR